MKVIDVYKQYFSATCVYNGVERKGAVVSLTVTSDSGMVQYEVSISFFPHKSADDFMITYDAYASKELYHAKGRRSKKREEQILRHIQEDANELANHLNGKIDWKKPLNQAQYGS